ncbi:MAG: MBL fold metallo-hydrolase [Acidobacteriota bacterium]|nr:MBL fold metallo-hydrolase [Acidobacteriota bacterium]
MKRIKRALIAVGIIVLLAAGWVFYRLNDHPKLDGYKDLMMSASAEETGKLRVTFLGVSSLLFDDGDTQILTDGFFTRPGKLRTFFTRIEPDPTLIAGYLERAGINQLKAVIVLHSHYDHALDATFVARRTGAELIGSQSTANIGDTHGLSITIVREGEVLTRGRFKITLIRSNHVPSWFSPKDDIHTPLALPARQRNFKEGEVYSVFIEHDGKTILVQGSAGYIPGGLAGRHADIVFLAIGQLGCKDDKYRADYWHEVVEAVNPRRIIPIHWDDFWLPLDQPLVPMPRLIDNFDKSMEFLGQRAGHSNPSIDLRILPAWVKVDPWAGLQ